jgi:hypothetical protein
MNFRINDRTSSDADFIVFDEGVDSQEYVAEEQEIEEIEEKVHRRRAMAIDYGRRSRKFDADEITKDYMTYIIPEEGYLMAIDEDH